MALKIVVMRITPPASDISDPHDESDDEGSDGLKKIVVGHAHLRAQDLVLKQCHGDHFDGKDVLSRGAFEQQHQRHGAREKQRVDQSEALWGEELIADEIEAKGEQDQHEHAGDIKELPEESHTGVVDAGSNPYQNGRYSHQLKGRPSILALLPQDPKTNDDKTNV